MNQIELVTRLVAHKPGMGPVDRLEARIKRFLERNRSTESLDSLAFAMINGSDPKADFLLGSRRFVAELKTINGNPKERIERRLQERFGRPDAPIVFGEVGMEVVLEGMPDQHAIRKMIIDVSSRAVRRHLQKAEEQIAFTKARLNLRRSVGLVIILNDGDPFIDVGTIAYAVRAAFETVPSGYPSINYVWVSVESHLVKMVNGGLGPPQLLISRQGEDLFDIRFLGTMIDAWAEYNGADPVQVDQSDFWGSMEPIYAAEPPVFSLFQ